MGSEWGACSTACGGGEQTRHVGCYHPSNGTRAQDIFCQGSSPAESRPCNQAPCAASWYLARVSSCADPSDQPMSAPLCMDVQGRLLSAEAVPSTTQPRSAEATSYTWYIGAWEACSAECGGGEASRAVHCVTPIGDIVEDGRWSGRECEIPASCESGIVDGLGLCCAAGVVSAAGSCCASPSAVLDAQGDCCNAGVVDACGVCGGAAQFADVQGACCATALDAAGVCCASGRLDGCGMCNGKGASCSTRGTVNLQIANLAAGDTSAAHLNATLTGLLGAALGSSVVITDMQLPPEWTAALPSEQEPVQMQTRRLRGHALASLIRGASQLLRLSSAGAAAPAEPAEEPTLRLRFAAAPLAGLHLASVVAAIGEAEQQGTCGDGICQAGERDASHTALACPEDCPHAFVSCPAPAAEGLHASKPCNGQGRPGLELGTCIRDASIVLPPTQNSPEKGASPKPSTAPGLTKALSAFQAFADAHVGDVRAKVPGGKVRSHLMEATYSFVAGIEFHPHLLAAVLVLTAAFIVAVHKIAAARS
ncbi:hypothetical protein WJX72_007793 [[Myrmecia] bisecta]|uniref:Uncharacterized protein n=1 Tax=[Myrmecia] bisecta TaxID=41462 RepID=A0AAW1PY99_9CHLO